LDFGPRTWAFPKKTIQISTSIRISNSNGFSRRPVSSPDRRGRSGKKGTWRGAARTNESRTLSVPLRCLYPAFGWLIYKEGLTVKKSLAALLLATLVAPSSPLTTPTHASSHREALAVLNEPCADNTDTYAWVSDGSCSGLLTCRHPRCARHRLSQQPKRNRIGGGQVQSISEGRRA
jgi:hypothetical protein